MRFFRSRYARFGFHAGNRCKQNGASVLNGRPVGNLLFDRRGMPLVTQAAMGRPIDSPVISLSLAEIFRIPSSSRVLMVPSGIFV